MQNLSNVSMVQLNQLCRT